MKRLGSKEKSVEGKERIAKLIGLYENRKISQVQTVEKMIKELTRPSMTEKQQLSIFKKYYMLVGKHDRYKPLAEDG